MQLGFIECEKIIFQSLFLAEEEDPDYISHLVTRCFLPRRQTGNGGNFASPPTHIKLLFRTSHQERSITIVAGNVDAYVL
ncbi:MAG: hypothetical protein D6816_02205 [Bacteroidetes bacterium]|nr:MAG: hypothetical protein D6816_02205 [Bacteroidota bacterium]